MNRSLQEYFRCIINGNGTRYTEWSTDVKLFPLSYNSQITTTLGLSPYEMVFNQKPRKSKMFTANSYEMVYEMVFNQKPRKSKMFTANQLKNQYVTIYRYTPMMEIIFIIHKS